MKDNGFIYGLADTKVTSYVSLVGNQATTGHWKSQNRNGPQNRYKICKWWDKISTDYPGHTIKFSGHLILAFDSLIWGFCRFNITDRILHGNKTWYLDLCRFTVTMIDVLYVYRKVFTTKCILNHVLVSLTLVRMIF